MDAFNEEMKKQIELNPNIFDGLFLKEGQFIIFKSEDLIKVRDILQNYRDAILDLRYRMDELKEQIRGLK